MSIKIIPIDSLGENKRICQKKVEINYLNAVQSNKKGTKQKFYKDLEEACIFDVVITAEDLIATEVEKREEPDITFEFQGNSIAVEIRKVDILNDSSSNNNQYARWRAIQKVIEICESELSEQEEYKTQIISVRYMTRLFDLNVPYNETVVKNSLLSVITKKEIVNDYWADAEVLPRNFVDDTLQSNDGLLMPIQQSRSKSPKILLHGVLPIQELTIHRIRECIKEKENLLPRYKTKLQNNGYKPSQYWLVMHIPNEFIVSYNCEHQQIDSLYDRVYLVDLYYKRQIIRLK